MISPQAVDNLSRVAASCGWIVDPDILAATQRRDAETMFAIERQRVLNTYLGTPLRDDLQHFRVNDDGDLYIDLPAPVDRAYLGVGIAVADVLRAREIDRGILCLAGAWILDEIILSECYPEDTFDAELLNGILDPPPIPRPFLPVPGP